MNDAPEIDAGPEEGPAHSMDNIETLTRLLRAVASAQDAETILCDVFGMADGYAALASAFHKIVLELIEDNATATDWATMRAQLNSEGWTSAGFVGLPEPSR